MFLELLDPDPLVRGMDPDPDPAPEPDFVPLFDFLFVRNDVNVASKSNKQKKLCNKICSWSRR